MNGKLADALAIGKGRPKLYLFNTTQDTLAS
jgi:hypothetical protein